MADILALLNSLNSSTSPPNITATDFTNFTGATNSTEASSNPAKSVNATLKQIFDIALIVATCITMAALGCTIECKVLKAHLRRPVGIIIGLICQFIIFPAVAFGLAHALKLSKWNAVGMILLASSPGGSISNIFTLYCEGDVTLSVAMTAVSTVVGIGMMPLNAWIYTRSWADYKTVIPITNIVIGLATLLVPVAIGMVIRVKLPKVAKWFLRAGVVVGMLIVAGIITIGSILFPAIYTSEWRMYVAACLLSSIGLATGYIASSIARMPQPCRRAIAIETGSQNAALCITLITISYDASLFLQVALFAEIFVICGYPITLICIGMYHLHKCITAKNQKLHKKEPEFENSENNGCKLVTYKDVKLG